MDRADGERSMTSSHDGTSHAALTRAEWLPVLFAERPTRASLLALRPSWPLDRVSVRVHRNVACELVMSVAAPYLAFAGVDVEWRWGDYDDSLTFAAAGDADVELIWIDFARFRASDAATLAEWLVERIRYLRQSVRAPLLVNTDTRASADSTVINAALAQAAAAVPGVYICDLSPIREQLGDGFLDARNAQLIGLPYSNLASVLIARRLGSRWLPGVVRSRLKAIVLDLDHTLYEGVLGEDGVEGVRLTEEHAELQRQLLAYREQGMFLGVCSKNEPADVAALFSSRGDFPLREEHLSARAIGWTGKAAGLQAIARQLRIGIDAMLYVDDNPGELAAIAAVLPDIRLLHAGPDPRITRLALSEYPGLHQWRRDDADRLRVADLAAASQREREATTVGDGRGYMKSLQLCVRFRVDLPADLERLHALSSKTNQFNLRIRRLQASEAAAYVEAAGAHAVAVELADRLSDSGVIGAVFFRTAGDRCHVEEVCISCRALGRGLEDLLVLGAIRAAVGAACPAAVSFDYSTGPRNGPARQWLEALGGEPLAARGTAVVPWQTCADRLALLDDLVQAPVVSSQP